MESLFKDWDLYLTIAKCLMGLFAYMFFLHFMLHSMPHFYVDNPKRREWRGLRNFLREFIGEIFDSILYIIFFDVQHYTGRGFFDEIVTSYSISQFSTTQDIVLMLALDLTIICAAFLGNAFSIFLYNRIP